MKEIFERRSIRKYTSLPVSDIDIENYLWLLCLHQQAIISDYGNLLL